SRSSSSSAAAGVEPTRAVRAGIAAAAPVRRKRSRRVRPSPSGWVISFPPSEQMGAARKLGTCKERREPTPVPVEGFAAEHARHRRHDRLSKQRSTRSLRKGEYPGDSGAPGYSEWKEGANESGAGSERCSACPRLRAC